MRLHTDADAFLALLRLVNENTGIRPDVLEKARYRNSSPTPSN